MTQPRQKSPPNTRDAPEQSLPGRILVVDDHRDARQSMAAVLRQAGHHVDCRSSAIEALRIVSRDEVRRIAKFVDDKMWEISENNNLISTEKVAILTALNIAEDYLGTLEQRKRETERVERKTSSIIKLIDESRT